MKQLIIAGMLGGLVLAGQSDAAEPLPDAGAVTQRMIARAAAVAATEHGPHYTYVKRSLVEELDGHGKVIKSEERLYQVKLIAGFPFDRLLEIKGKKLSPEQLKKEDQQEEQFRKKFSGVDIPQKAARKEGWVTALLLERYAMVVQERVVWNNRPTLVLGFRPHAGKLPGKTVQDKFLNQLEGTVWVDEADADVAKLSVKLMEPISLGWLGILGSLHCCELVLERQRQPADVWGVNRQVLLIQGRKLINAFRFRATEEANGFTLAVSPH